MSGLLESPACSRTTDNPLLVVTANSERAEIEIHSTRAKRRVMEDEITVRTMDSADSVGLSDCIRRCYGNGYANRLTYEPTVLTEQLNSRAYRGVVAVDGHDIVGHIGYNFPTPFATVVEAGTTVVGPVYRGRVCSVNSHRLCGKTSLRIVRSGSFIIRPPPTR